MSLSSLIVQREIATIRQVEEALARQVLYGGDLATNLLEVAAVEEWRVAVTFADSFGVAAAPPGALAIAKPETLALLPSEVAARRGIVPLSGDAQRLIVATAEPLRKEDVDEIASSLRVRLDPRIALEARVREGLQRAYGIPLERRIERLLGKLGKQADGTPPSARVPSNPPRSPSVPPFKLSPSYGTSSGRPPPPPESDSLPELTPDAQPVSPAPPPPPSRPRHITAAGFPAPAPTLDVLPPEAPAPPVTVPTPKGHATGAWAETKPTFVKPTSNSVPPARRRRGPLTAAIAAEELKGAGDRNALLDLFFEFARQFFDYAALFIAHGEIAEGRDASGEGAPRERVVGIGVPLDMPSILQAARERKEPVVMRPSPDGVDGILISDLRRPASVEAAVIPVLVRGRPVALLYGDATSGVDRDALDEVARFAAAVGQGFERLIVRKKLAGFSGGAPDSTAGKVDARSLAVAKKAASASEKIERAGALGRALFEEPSQQEPEAEPRDKKRTDPETPAARGSIPPVLSAPPSAPPPQMDRMPATEAGRARARSSRPPPPQAAAVRIPAGPPIPREEPESQPVLEVREPSAELEAAALDDAEAAAVLQEISTAEESLAEDGEEVLLDVVPPAPESEQAVSVGPHRPPPAHSEKALPSIIVDIEGELAALVDRVLGGADDGQSEAELLRQGASAMPAIMARFPGPLARSRADIREPLPRASECGPLLRLIARQRKVALAYVLEEVGSPDVSRRFWATYLLAELPYAEGARLLVPRLFDPDPKVRLVARAAARAMAETAHDALLAEIARIVREPSTSRTARLGLLEALGDMREPKAVALLVGHLSDEDAEIATVARRALIAITRQDFALDTRKWLAWWGQNSSRHRIEWLIDALEAETPGIRRAAGDELKTLTQETFGYYDDLPKRERERAQQRFRDWWASEGRARFVRS
ncbi:MAG TPA: hypothetical protein VGH28_34050 [Polyangiaceae bacterium]|jgi:hypothetical protein